MEKAATMLSDNRTENIAIIQSAINLKFKRTINRNTNYYKIINKTQTIYREFFLNYVSEKFHLDFSPYIQ